MTLEIIKRLKEIDELDFLYEIDRYNIGGYWQLKNTPYKLIINYLLSEQKMILRWRKYLITVEFEDILLDVPEDIQIKLLFNIDLLI